MRSTNVGALLFALRLLGVPFALAQDSTTLPAPQPTPAPVTENVVVSATRGPEIETEIPGQATVVTGEELRRRNARTLADALQDVVGLDTGNGSDNGARLPNIGLWGLKEFDALLVMVDGVPVGGPFNPSLSQIDVADIDRIEIVKGPQGTLYGASAFAGMVQVFTKEGSTGTQVRVSGGSFSTGRLSLSHTVNVGAAKLRLFGSFDRSNGWQDRTDYKGDRGGLRLDTPVLGAGKLSVTFDLIRDTQFFGSPLPVENGQPVDRFRIDRNYEVKGARIDHHVYSLTTRWRQPLSGAVLLENVLGIARDNQISIRSFIDGVEGNEATAAGVALKPHETDVYDDLHVTTSVSAAGVHRLVAGAALTWGRTTATGTGFDIDLRVDPVDVPDFAETPAGDHRSFVDRRTFFGLYVNDEWTPVRFLTLTGGARYDRVSERLFAKGQEVGDPNVDVSRDSRSEGQWSGGLSALGRLVENGAGALSDANLYVAAKSAFKPAAPNLTEAENAEILKPERTRSGEIGVKTRWLDRQVSFDVSVFHVIFENLVVSNVGPSGEPELVNAGSERFQGSEFTLGYRPGALSGLSFLAGYAHHDARFIEFSFLTPDGDLRVVNGKRLELVPRDLWNARLEYATGRGPSVFFALRHQNRRPLNGRNLNYTDSFFESDAGVGWDFPWGRISFAGRNLGDDRHYVAESEIGDSQFDVAAPRRFTAEVAFRF
ncbi:MAG TPA: TonB-dependent receptor [Thermoanaerobaculia bacterium]